MGLEKTLREFSTALRRLDDRIRELRVTVVEDRPSRNDGVVPDNLELAVEDLLGWLQEASIAASAAYKAVQHPIDMDGARQALGTCQERFQRLDQVFSLEPGVLRASGRPDQLRQRAPRRMAHLGTHRQARNRSVPCAHG